MALKSPEGGAAGKLAARFWRRGGAPNGGAPATPDRIVIPGSSGAPTDRRGGFVVPTTPEPSQPVVKITDATASHPPSWPEPAGNRSDPASPDGSDHDGAHQSADPQTEPDQEVHRVVIGPRALRAMGRPDGFRARPRPLGDGIRSRLGTGVHDTHHGAKRDGGTVKHTDATHVAGVRQHADEHLRERHGKGFGDRTLEVVDAEERARHGRSGRETSYHQDTSDPLIGGVRETLMLASLRLGEDHLASQAYLRTVQEQWAHYMGDGPRPLSEQPAMFGEPGEMGGLLLGHGEPGGRTVDKYIKQQAEKVGIFWHTNAAMVPQYFTGRDTASLSGDADDRQTNRLGQGRAVRNIMRHIEDLDERYSDDRAMRGEPYQGSPHTFGRRIRVAAVLQAGGDHARAQAAELRQDAARLKGRRSVRAQTRMAELTSQAAEAEALGITAQKNADDIVREAFAKELEAKQKELAALPWSKQTTDKRAAVIMDINALTPVVAALAA